MLNQNFWIMTKFGATFCVEQLKLQDEDWGIWGKKTQNYEMKQGNDKTEF